jgi:glyoxylase-like metal-dependent hydrolase (beta-lactamase superfamily II)
MISFPRALFSLGLALACAAAHAAPPEQSLPQAPGYYRQNLGTLRVTALFDGAVALPRQQLVGVPRSRIDGLLQHRHVPETTQGLQTAVNAYLVQRGQDLVLVDAGTAQCLGDQLGHVLQNLRQSGYRPEDVSAVLLTHAHPDHLCGVLDEQGNPAFPNATLWIAREEADFTFDPQTLRVIPKEFHPFVAMAQRALTAYDQLGKLRRFEAGQTLPVGINGITALASHGHSPGHSSFLFSGDQGQKLLIWGDIVHYHAVQFAVPEASYEVDANRAQAIQSRRRLLADAARQGWWVAGAHLPFPGLGHVRAEGKAFAWVPAEYSPGVR